MSECQGRVVPMSSPPSEDSEQPKDGQVSSPCPRRHLPRWEGNESKTILVVATLITALTSQVGTNIPGGCWQDDKLGVDGHAAGDPIMRDKHRKRYWLFMTARWMGFGSSMLMTVSLLTGVPVQSRRIQWPFVVAYSSLMLTFITSQPRTSLAMDLTLWVCFLLVLWAAISFRNLQEKFRWRAPFDRIRNSFSSRG